MQTIRQEIISILDNTAMDARELSKKLGIREKKVYEHLEHIRRSVKIKKKKLIVNPFTCLLCNYVFKDRKRLSRPSRCPKCKKSHIEPARFEIRTL